MKVQLALNATLAISKGFYCWLICCLWQDKSDLNSEFAYMQQSVLSTVCLVFTPWKHGWVQIGMWMSTRQICPNASKMQVLRLSSQHNIDGLTYAMCKYWHQLWALSAQHATLELSLNDSQLTVFDHTASVWHSACLPSATNSTYIAVSQWMLLWPDLLLSIYLQLPVLLHFVLYGIADNLCKWLQSLQEAAARLITWTSWHEHIIPVLWKRLDAVSSLSGLLIRSCHCMTMTFYISN